jgi:hypothetical protein
MEPLNPVRYTAGIYMCSCGEEWVAFFAAQEMSGHWFICPDCRVKVWPQKIRYVEKETVARLLQ